jgi:hypothetical protein
MNDLIFDREETVRLLRDSLATVLSAACRVPAAYTHANPEWYAPEDWSVAMNIAHVTTYEDAMANPVLAAMADGGDGVGVVESGLESWFLPRSEALAAESIDVLLARFRAAREEHAAIALRFDVARWNEGITPLWSSGRHGSGLHSPAWVAMKTFQHTWEHGNAILRMALFAPRP